MSASAEKPEVFVRKASGLVRVMSPWAAFFYNILTMGIIFPWTYLWAPGALPGGKLVWGILLTIVVQIPIALVYVWLSTALPRSGGDYVFQSRVFGGGVAFTVVMSGFVIWILQWVALSGWLVSYLGFAPLFLGLGATLQNSFLSNLGVWFTQPSGIVIVSVINAFIAAILLVTGFKNYIKLQYVMIVATGIAFITTLIVIFTTSPAAVPEKLNAFSAAVGGSPNFYQEAIEAVVSAGIDLNPPFSLIATLLIVPIAWTSLMWSAYSVQQNGEIKDARSLKNQLFIILGSLVVAGFLLALLAIALEKTIGTEFLYVAGAGYWALIDKANIAGFNLWPPILAVAFTGSPLVVILISFGYLMNGHQIVYNCYIGMTRVMVAMSLDRILPEFLSRVHDRFHTPANAHWVYFIASIPVILAYNLIPEWIGLTLGVTFAGGYVILMTVLAGTLLPYKAKEVYESSPGAKYQINGLVTFLSMVLGVVVFILAAWTLSPQAFENYPILIWAIRLLAVLLVIAFLYPLRKQIREWVLGRPSPFIVAMGMLGGGFSSAIVVAFLLAPQLGVLGYWNFEDFPKNLWPQIIAFGLVLVCGIWYWFVKTAQKKRGIDVDYAFREIPPE